MVPKSQCKSNEGSNRQKGLSGLSVQAGALGKFNWLKTSSKSTFVASPAPVLVMVIVKPICSPAVMVALSATFEIVSTGGGGGTAVAVSVGVSVGAGVGQMISTDSILEDPEPDRPLKSSKS